MRNLSLSVLVMFILVNVVLAQDVDRVATAAKAQELLKQAREAIGGEANLKGFQTLVIEGKFKNAMMGRPMSGELKIEMMMPDKYLRTASMDMGLVLLQCVNGDQVWTDRKMPDMGAMGGGGSGMGGAGGGGGMGEGGGVGGGGGMGGASGGGMGGGGMGGGGRRGGGGGMGMPSSGGRPGGGMGAFGGDMMEKMARNDYHQMMLAWFLTAPANLPVEYAYERVMDIKNGKADVVRVVGPNDFLMWLLLDQQSHRVAGFVYRTNAPRRPDVTDAREVQEPAPVNVQVFFDDYKQVGSLQLPHQITKISNNQLLEEFKVSKVKFNEKLKEKKFEKKS